jgi:siroheme synthase-like protein
MGYYPVFLDLTGQPCVVVGGGMLAERKVEGLRSVGATVTVVAPSLTPLLRGLAARGDVQHVRRDYVAGDLAGARVVLVAVDDPRVSAEVAREAHVRGLWVNVSDDVRHSTFFLPAVLRREALTVAVGTGGTSPALARAVRDWLDAELPDDLGALAMAAGRVRRQLIDADARPTAAQWREALQREIEERLVDRLRGAR